MTETRLVLGKTPKLRLVPWARTAALGITHGGVGLLGKAKANQPKSFDESNVSWGFLLLLVISTRTLRACGCCGHGTFGGTLVTQSHVSLRGHKAVPVVRPTGAGMWRSLSAQGGVGTAGLQSPVVPWVLLSPGAWQGLMEGTGWRVMTAATQPWVSAEPPWAVPHPHSCCPEQSQARCQRDVGSQKKIQPQNVFRGSSIPECIAEKRHKGGFLCREAGSCLAGSPMGQRGRIRPWDAVCAELGGANGDLLRAAV